MGNKNNTTLSALPVYQVAAHSVMMDGVIKTSTDVATYAGNPAINMADFLEAAWLSGSPYSASYAYDPSDDLTEVEELLTTLSDEAVALNAITEWEAALDAVETKADAAFGDVAGRISGRAAYFDSEYAATHAAALARIGAPLRDQLSSASPSYLMALALAEQARAAASVSYLSKLEEINEQGRVAMLNTAPTIVIQLEQSLIDARRLIIASKDVLARVKILAMREYYQEDLDLSVKDLTWDMSLLSTYGLPMLGSIGSPALEQGPSKVSTAISTGLTVASTAVQMGAGPALTAGAGAAALLVSLLL